VPYVNGESAPTQASGRPPPAPRAPGWRRSFVRITASRADPSLPRLGSPSTPWDGERLPGYGRMSASTVDERQPAASSLRQRYEASFRGPSAPRGPSRSAGGKHCESGDLVVPHAFVPADLRVGTGGHSVTGLRLRHGLQLQQGARPAVVFVADGRRAWSSDARRSRTSPDSTLEAGTPFGRPATCSFVNDSRPADRHAPPR